MGKHKNTRQEDAIIKFMEDHPDIAKGFTKGDKIDTENLWKQFTKDLNSLGPPVKDISGWKKVWCDWKASIKKKISINKKESIATGGGPYNQMYISKKEEVIGQICGLYIIVEGIPKSNSFGAEESSGESTSSDEEDSATDQPTTSKDATVSRKRKRDANETLSGQPLTSKSNPIKRNDNFKDHLKEYIGSDIKNGKELSESLKMLAETNNKNADKLNEVASNIRRVYKSVENLTTNLTNELKRHHKEMEKAAFQKNLLKQKDLEIKQKQLELEQLKNP